MGFCFHCKVYLEIFFCLSIDITDRNRVKIMRLPILLGGLVFEDIRIHLHFFLMILQITVIDHIIVSLISCLQGFASDSFLLGGGGAFLRRLEMMIFLVNVADDIVIYNRVFARSIVPRFGFWVVWPVLQS